MENSLINFRSRDPRESEDVYDFAELSLPAECIAAIGPAFRGLTHLYRKVSRRQFWRSMRKFAVFLNAAPDPYAALRAPRCLMDFRDHLRGSILDKTAGGHYNHISAIYQWLVANDDSHAVIWHNVRRPPFGHAREEEKPRAKPMDSVQLRRIGEAAARRVDIIRARLETGAAICRGESVLGVSSQVQRWVRQIHEGMQAKVFSKAALTSGRYVDWQVSYRVAVPYVHIQKGDYIPYILLILIETAANPLSILNLELGCVSHHPTDPARRRVYWNKHRAGSEQASDVTETGRNSIPRLINELEAATLGMRAGAPERYNSLLFLGYGNGSIGPVSIQSFHNYLELFIQEEGLPDFNFVDIRQSIASQMLERGDDLIDIKKQLQHASPRTTLGYVRSSRDKQVLAERMLEFQGQLITATEALAKPKDLDTSYGFTCSSNMDGLAPGSKKGEPCLQYFQCALCPNSIAVIDSPTHLARMMVALESLDEYGDVGGFMRQTKRYQEVFSPIVEILKELINRAPKRVLAKALEIAKELPLVPMEE